MSADDAAMAQCEMAVRLMDDERQQPVACAAAAADDDANAAIFSLPRAGPVTRLVKKAIRRGRRLTDSASTLDAQRLTAAERDVACGLVQRAAADATVRGVSCACVLLDLLPRDSAMSVHALPAAPDTLLEESLSEAGLRNVVFIQNSGALTLERRVAFDSHCVDCAAYWQETTERDETTSPPTLRVKSCYAERPSCFFRCFLSEPDLGWREPPTPPACFNQHFGYIADLPSTEKLK